MFDRYFPNTLREREGWKKEGTGSTNTIRRTLAVNKYGGQRQHVAAVCPGAWEISTSLGRRSQQEAVSSVIGGETEGEQYGPYSSDGDEEMMEVVVKDDVENQEVARSSTDIEDRHKDIFQRMEMERASARERALKLMREPSEGTQMELEQALQLAFGQPFSSTDTDKETAQGLKPLICKKKSSEIFIQRSLLRKDEQAKRKPTVNIPTRRWAAVRLSQGLPVPIKYGDFKWSSYFVSEVKKQEEKKAKNDRSKHLSTVLYETAKYLKTTSAQEQNVEVVEKFIRAIRPYKLTAAETMQIINLRPTTAAEIQLIVEESEERIKTEEKLESLVATVIACLPPHIITTS
ncbi:hypothetical protein RB195_018744 [Necator americanus]|uniref:DNA-directed RNA polymerase III subunit RPC9 n=1 Tax=Necator americanus TaxID=51031 RepID=A0ABR1CCY7_NECAM